MSSVKSGGSASWLGSLMQIAFSQGKWKWTISIILVVFTLFSGIVDSVNQQSIMPFVDQVGKKVVLADDELAAQTNIIVEESKSVDASKYSKVEFFMKNIDNYYSIIRSLWFIGILFLIFYIVSSWVVNNNSAVMSRTMIALSLLVIINMVVLAVYAGSDGQVRSVGEFASEITPFRGIFTVFLPNIGTLINPVSGGIQNA